MEGEGGSLYLHGFDNHVFELHTGTLEQRLARYGSPRGLTLHLSDAASLPGSIAAADGHTNLRDGPHADDVSGGSILVAVPSGHRCSGDPHLRHLARAPLAALGAPPLRSARPDHLGHVASRAAVRLVFRGPVCSCGRRPIPPRSVGSHRLRVWAGRCGLVAPYGGIPGGSPWQGGGVDCRLPQTIQSVECVLGSIH